MKKTTAPEMKPSAISEIIMQLKDKCHTTSERSEKVQIFAEVGVYEELKRS